MAKSKSTPPGPAVHDKLEQALNLTALLSQIDYRDIGGDDEALAGLNDQFDRLQDLISDAQCELRKAGKQATPTE